MTERKPKKQTLQQRIKFEHLIARISTMFINLKPDNIGRGIQQALESIGNFAGADRSYVFLISEGGTCADNVYELSLIHI